MLKLAKMTGLLVEDDIAKDASSVPVKYWKKLVTYTVGIGTMKHRGPRDLIKPVLEDSDVSSLPPSELTEEETKFVKSPKEG